MALAESTSEDMQVKDEQDACENVMQIFSSFQQMFNTEQDIREVYVIIIIISDLLCYRLCSI